MTYEQLDAVADSVTPTLALIALLCLCWPAAAQRGRSSWLRAAQLFGAVLIAYTWMLLDAWLVLWPQIGLDYSTHTAVALALVMFLSHQRPKWSPLWLATMLGYAALMRYQDYHSLAEMLSTAIVVGSSIALSWWPLLRQNAKQAS